MKMRGRDRINPVLPDELILEVFHKLDSKPSHAACSLVCQRWLGLARLNRTTIRVGSSDNADALVQMLARRFVNVRNVFINERLSISLPVLMIYNELLGYESLDLPAMIHTPTIGTAATSLLQGTVLNRLPDRTKSSAAAQRQPFLRWRIPFLANLISPTPFF